MTPISISSLAQPMPSPRNGRSGAGESFSDDPFARMLEQNRQETRLQARRVQDRQPQRETPQPTQADAEPEPQAAASRSGRLQAAAAVAAETATPSKNKAAIDAPTRDAPGLSGQQGGAAQTPARRAAAAEARPSPGSASAEPAPETETSDPGASGVKRALVIGPVECPAAPLSAHAPQASSTGCEQGQTTVSLHKAAETDSLTKAVNDITADAGEASQAQAAAEAETPHGPPADPPSPVDASSLQAAARQTPALNGTAAPAAAAAPDTPAQASLNAAPHSEAFGLQLSHQVTLWLRQGVTEARLHLNPAELGPVQIAISLDGQAAQVRLTAEHLPTRLALEQALPSLAGSLAEAGFMLAGGGVFDQQQAPPQRQPHLLADSGHAAQAADGQETAHQRPASAAATRGMVDLVA